MGELQNSLEIVFVEKRTWIHGPAPNEQTQLRAQRDIPETQLAYHNSRWRNQPKTAQTKSQKSGRKPFTEKVASLMPGFEY